LNNQLKAKLGGGFSGILNIEHLLLTSALANKSAAVVGGQNNNAPPSVSRNVVCHINRQSTLGRKSNNKKRFSEARSLIEKEENRQKIVACLILFQGSALFIWGILLFRKTFISTQTQIIVTLIGAVIGIIVLYFFWRNKKYGIVMTLFYGFFLGGPIPYCFVATTNYYFRDNKPKTVQLNIIATGNRSARKSKCRTPYATVEYQDIKIDILFACDYEKTISNFKTVMLTVSKGSWGYMVYTDKQLND
jgi:hypothetical protein